MLRKRVFAKTQVILVTALVGIKTGMSIGQYFKNAKNGDVFGQKLIEPTHKFSGKFAFKIKMCKVLLSMDSGIGAATARNFQFGPQDGTHVFFQGLLHRVFTGLALPAEVMGAIVGEFDEISFHKK